MSDKAYRSIFPNNNIPKVEVEFKEPTLLEKLSDEVNALSKYADFSKVLKSLKELEFDQLVHDDPVAALLEKLKEVSNSSN